MPAHSRLHTPEAPAHTVLEAQPNQTGKHWAQLQARAGMLTRGVQRLGDPRGVHGGVPPALAGEAVRPGLRVLLLPARLIVVAAPGTGMVLGTSC